jgi:diguanylate cyclase (GGDEF)-like protein/PAS domain S-box-containing protein
MSDAQSVDSTDLIAALDALDVAVVLATPDEGIIHCNAVARDNLGFDPRRLGRDVFSVSGHDAYREDGTPWPLDERPHRTALREARVVANELMELRRDGQSRWLRVSAHPLFRTGEPTPYAVVGIFRDVTRQRAGQVALAESEAHFRLLAENAGDLITRHTVDGICTYASPSARELFSMEPEELLGDYRNAAAVHEEDLEELSRLHQSLLETAEPYTARYRALHRDGRWIWVETVSRPVLAPDGRLVEIQSATRDITARVEQEQRLARLALGDALTGLPNRAALTQFLEDQLQSQLPFALLFLDLDRFKVVNDSLGHIAGDELLRTVAGRLSSTCRDGDMVARLGGDEFVLVAGRLDEVAAVHLADRLQRVLAVPVTVGGHELVITASIGIVLSDPAEPADAESLLRDADISMYQAKSKGRARAVVWKQGFVDAAVHRLGIEGELRAALERDELVVHYQPQVELSSGRIIAVEALVRWLHPTRGLLPPGEFLTVADDSGLIVELGRQVLRRAVRQVAAWRELPAARELELSVNYSALELLQPGRLEETLAELAAVGLPPSALTIEVLESVLFDEEGEMRTVLSAFARSGLQLALDDFGTGSSSLIGLGEVPVGALKIDRAFVSRIGSSPQHEAIVRAIQSLSNDLGLHCVAEGVESEAQRTWLAAEQVGFAQGYLLHRPLPAEALESLLRAAGPPAAG